MNFSFVKIIDKKREKELAFKIFSLYESIKMVNKIMGARYFWCSPSPKFVTVIIRRYTISYIIIDFHAKFIYMGSNEENRKTKNVIKCT